MFYLIGIGLKPEHLTLEAKKAIEKCSEVFLENYTSIYSEGKIEDLEKIIGKKIRQLWRKDVEEGFSQILEKSKCDDVALLVYGNALSATTHIQLLLDAAERQVDYRVIAGISIFDFLGATGLEQYRFGRTATIVQWEKNFTPESFYDIILQNLKAGLHTLCLLDIKAEQGKMMSVKEAIETLKKIEAKRKGSALKSALLVAASNAFSAKEKIAAGSAAQLRKINFGTPAILIVCGKLSEKEKETLARIRR